MLAERYQKARDLILFIEKKFPINNWKLNGIHLWPFIRIRLYLFIVEQQQLNISHPEASNNTEKTSSQKNIFLNKLKIYLKLPASYYKQISNYFLYKIWLKKLTSKKYLFVGHNHHRVDYLGKKFNRFYDPLIEQHNLQGNFNVLEYWCNDEKDITYREASIQYEIGKKYYEKSLALLTRLGIAKVDADLEDSGFTELASFLESQEISKGFIDQYINLKKRYRIISSHSSFFENLYKKTNPQYVFSLCYYIDEIMLLINIANKKNIKTIEMQHGPVAENHLAYGNWSNIPSDGYDCLPKNFWCWDETSKHSINNLTENSNGIYTAFIGGHPWVQYWKNKPIETKLKNIILYSLQPIYTPQELFPESVINIIKSLQYKWFIRLHPRQLDDKKIIVDYLKEKQILDLVDIEYATKEMLPVLLKNTLLHITHFSGTTLEAAMFEIPTILLSEMGKDYFTYLVNNHQAVYLNPGSKTFEIEFQEFVAKEENVKDKTIKSNIDEVSIGKIFSN